MDWRKMALKLTAFSRCEMEIIHEFARGKKNKH
jgi:hypothetical protein